MEDPTKDTIFYEYDEVDQLVAVKYPDGTIIRYSYDAAGNRTQVIIEAPKQEVELPPATEVKEGQTLIESGAGVEQAEITGTVIAETVPPVERSPEANQDTAVGFADTSRDFPVPVRIWQISIREGPYAGQVIDLQARNTLGRQPDNDIVISDLKISRHHAVIEKEGDAYKLRDLESVNGTLLNGIVVMKDPVALKEGDVITLGDTVLHVGIDVRLKKTSRQGTR